LSAVAYRGTKLGRPAAYNVAAALPVEPVIASPRGREQREDGGETYGG
jgi:hypothetical protein